MHQEGYYPILQQGNTKRKEKDCMGGLVNCDLTRSSKGVRVHEIEKPGNLGSSPKPGTQSLNV